MKKSVLVPEDQGVVALTGVGAVVQLLAARGIPEN